VPADLTDPAVARFHTEVVAVGRIGKAHGIRGDVFVEPWTDAPAERFVPGALMSIAPVGDGPSHTGGQLAVDFSRDHSGKLVVHFRGVDDRDAAEAIRGAVLTMPASARPPLADSDEFYDTDLIGLAAHTVSGLALGRVVDVLHVPGGSLLAVDFNGREVLVPFRREFVPVIDLASGIARIDPPEGLLDL